MKKQDEIPQKYSHDWLEKLDGRTAIAKAVNVRYHALTHDLGGHDNLSYQQRSLCKRAIYVECVIELQEAALARGEEVDQGRLTQSINTLIGLLKTLGLSRQAKDIPNLAEYLSQQRESKS